MEEKGREKDGIQLNKGTAKEKDTPFLKKGKLIGQSLRIQISIFMWLQCDQSKSDSQVNYSAGVIMDEGECPVLSEWAFSPLWGIQQQ